ncbi:hypothetical protein BOX15_Mlig008429g1, partial [Macrostomum lignano]
MESLSGSEGSKPSEPPEGSRSQNVNDEKLEAKTLEEQKEELQKLELQNKRLEVEEKMKEIEKRRKNKKFEQQDLKLPEIPAEAPEVPSELTQMCKTQALSEEDIKKGIASLWTTKEGSPQPVCTVDANAVVSNASGEHLQKGMKLEGGVWKQCSSTRLLEPATGVKLVQPSCALPAGESTFEFFSSESLNKFSADVFSLSIQGSFSVTGMLSTIELAASAKADFRSGERKQSMQQNSESVYAKCTVHTVPTAACLLECSNLHLSGRAIEELQNIEAMMTCKSDVTEEATNFFDQYGSHAIAGMIHFGGVHITTAHALYQSSSNLEMIKNSVSKALATAVKGGNLFIKGEPSDAGVASSSEDNTADKREKQSSNVQLKSQMFGGAPGASSVSKWCEGLVQDSSTWAVIDGSSDTVPVWQIVKANGQHFQDADALANALKKSWEERTGQKAPAESSDSYRQAVSCVQQRIDEFAQRVEKENLSEENWHLQLQTLCERVEAVEQLTDEEKRGVSWTRNPHFHTIMLAVVQALPTIRDAIKPIKSHISYLLQMSGSCSFPMKGRLYFQLACEQDENYSKLTDMGLDCPLKLAEAVEQTVLPDLQAFNVQHEGDSEKQRKVLQLVFVDLNTAVQHLLRRLKESGDAEKHFLTCTALARNSYSLQNDIFENLKNPESLQHLAQSLKESAQQLSVIKESSEPEFVQARLLHTAMDARFDDGCCFHVADWILLFQQSGIQWAAPLNEKLTDIADNSSRAWKELNEVVTHLLSNFSDNGQPLQLPENMVSELRDARSNTSEVVVTNSYKQQLDKDEMALIQRLGLAEYFPSKIGLIDVMKVGDEMYSAASDATRLPQKILKSIIQADYKSGFEIVEACNISPSEGKKAVSQSFWDDEDDEEDMAHE